MMKTKQFKVLTWWADNNLPWKEHFQYILCCCRGLIQTLKWLRERGCPWTADNYRNASATLQTQKGLLENGCPTTKEASNSTWFGF